MTPLQGAAVRLRQQEPVSGLTFWTSHAFAARRRGAPRWASCRCRLTSIPAGKCDRELAERRPARSVEHRRAASCETLGA